MKKQIALMVLTAALSCGTAGAQSGVKYPYITTATGGVVIVLRDQAGGVDETNLFPNKLTASATGTEQSSDNRMSRKIRVQKAQGQSSTVNWNTAISYCENLVEEGYDNWRLPTEREVQLIWLLGGNSNVVSGDKNDPGVGDSSVPLYTPYLYQQSGFTAFANGTYWTATQHMYDINRARFVKFTNGYTHVLDGEKSRSYYVRCVRDEW